MTARRLRPWASGLLLLLHLAWAGLALDPQQNCNRTQYEAHGKCCSRCPPGQSVRALCTEEGSDTVCTPCRDQHFQDGWTKEKVCTPHRYCDHNARLVVHIQGDATQNTVCLCQKGTHCSGRECQSCQENRACGPGEGVELRATNTMDTVCTECPHGFFSNISSATASCQLWSRCEATGLVHKADGTRFADTVCEEASKVRSGVWVPIAVAAVMVALGCLVLFLWHQRRRRRQQELQKWRHDQDQRHLDPSEEDDREDCPGLPVQETLPTTQEEAKESRLAKEERV